MSVVLHQYCAGSSGFSGLCWEFPFPKTRGCSAQRLGGPVEHEDLRSYCLVLAGSRAIAVESLPRLSLSGCPVKPGVCTLAQRMYVIPYDRNPKKGHRYVFETRPPGGLSFQELHHVQWHPLGCGAAWTSLAGPGCGWGCNLLHHGHPPSQKHSQCKMPTNLSIF